MAIAGRNRNVVVLFSLIASMTLGAVVLMAMDNHRPISGAYSLSSYLRLDPVEDVVKNTLTTAPGHWDQVEVYYSRTAGGNADELGLLMELANGSQPEFHFVVGNGNGTDDGHIQAGDLWKLQRLCQGRSGVVRVCVVGDAQGDSVTDCQIKRTHALVENLIHTFGMLPHSVSYPANWQM
ncbi:MAG: hypothetical protein L0Y36_02590 [Planctomycetales bacterium]|nr:hypothetical protein [Planctomycetales bacterium]